MTSLLLTVQTSTINGNTGSTLTIGNNLTTNAIQLGTSTNTVTIGGESTTTTVGGTLRTSTINGVTGTTLTIGNNLTTDSIQIGTSPNRTQTINIGNGASSTGQINIGSLSSVVSLGGGLSSLAAGITTNGLTLYGGSFLTLGTGSTPNSSQLGHTITTTSVHTNANTGLIRKVRFGSFFTCFSDNDGSIYYGPFLSIGTWLVNYSIVVKTNTTTVNWIYRGISELTYNSTASSYGTLLTGGENEFNFNQAANSGYSLTSSNFVYLNGYTVQKVPNEGYSNIRADISTVAASGTISIDGSRFTAVRIA